jgi:hypothetical protein
MALQGVKLWAFADTAEANEPLSLRSVLVSASFYWRLFAVLALWVIVGALSTWGLSLLGGESLMPSWCWVLLANGVFALVDVVRTCLLRSVVEAVFARRALGMLNTQRMGWAALLGVALLLQYAVVAYGLVWLCQANLIKTLVALLVYFSYHGVTYLLFMPYWRRPLRL